MKNPSIRIFLKAWLFICLAYPSKHIAAQCTVAGPQSGSSFTDDNIIGNFGFSSPANAAASDNNRATASAIISVLTGNTHYLEASSFGFSIPASASICGITVEVEKSAVNTGVLAWVTDHSIRMMKNGTITGNDYSTSSTWTSPDAYYSYGGPSDLWGTTWIASDINSSNFGVAFSSSITGIIGLLPSARIDHIRITVNYFDVPLALTSLKFSATALPDHSAKLEWSVINNDKGPRFNVERSTGQANWSVIYNQPGDITSSIQSYQYIDRNCVGTLAYYRLSVQSTSGVSYSPIASVKWKGALGIYPNPASDYILISDNNLAAASIKCIDISGRYWTITAVLYSDGLYKIDVSKLPKAMYIIEIGPSKNIFIKN